MAKVTIQYWAAAKEAEAWPPSRSRRDAGGGAGCVVARRGDNERLRSVLAVSSFLVDGAPAGRRVPSDLVLPDSARHRGPTPVRRRLAGPGPRVSGGSSPETTPPNLPFLPHTG